MKQEGVEGAREEAAAEQRQALCAQVLHAFLCVLSRKNNLGVHADKCTTMARKAQQPVHADALSLAAHALWK